MAHSKELQNHLESNPHIKNVWVAEDGEWYFVEVPNTSKLTREEVLGPKQYKTEPEGLVSAHVETPSPKKTNKK